MTATDEHGFWHGRSVLITGAAGFLGSWLTRRLVGSGADVVGLVRWDGAPWIPPTGATATRGDVLDGDALATLLDVYRIDTVFHLASQSQVGPALDDPTRTFEVNVAGTWTVLEACRRRAVQRVVVASSDKAYGDSDELPYEETTPLRASFPYDASKACADLIARTYAKTYGLAVAITRCGNFYGGGDRAWRRLVPGTITSVLQGRRPVIRSDGSFVRDYLYIEDAVSAYLTLAASLTDRPELSGEAFNFSSGEDLSVLAVVHRILEVMRTDLQPVVLDQVRSEIRSQRLSTDKARRLLGWTAEHDLNRGLSKTVTWYRENWREAA